MQKRYDKGFGRALVEQGLLSEQQLSDAVSEVQSGASSFRNSVLRLAGVQPRAYLDAMSRYLELPASTINIGSIDPAAVALVPATLSREYCVLPLKTDDDSLVLAIGGAIDPQAQEMLSFKTGRTLSLVLCDEQEVQDGIEQFYGGDAVTESEAQGADRIEYCSGREGEVGGDARDLEEPHVDEDHIINLVNGLISRAIHIRASDIHIEPKADHSIVRFRVDGVLAGEQQLPRDEHNAVISRIKVLATLNITERRRPQDGVIFLKFNGRDIDLRVATSPTIYGELSVLRVLDQDKARIELSKLGFDADDLAKITAALALPYGFILSTGPTGSGKTTTMYGMLNKLDRTGTKVVTIEDPVEYRMDGVDQIQVDPGLDLRFADYLRSVLRQDPNTILVGEIRDFETAHVAVQAALTGHLMLSTLHTTDAPEVLLRLMEIGIEHYYVREVVRLIIAQRLVRLLCPHCKQPYDPTTAELAEMKVESGGPLYRAVGCPACKGVGYFDRTGIYEVLQVTNEIKDLIHPDTRLHDIRDKAVEQGMVTLWTNAVERVLAGVTSLDEIRRTIPR